MSVRIGSAANFAGLFADGAQEAEYVAKVLALSPIGYWPLGEHGGSVAYDYVDPPNRNGAHAGVTLGQAGIGDGQTCPLYDGAAAHTNIYTATLAAAFDGNEGTLSIWGKVKESSVWADGAQRSLIRFAVDGNNYIELIKTVAANGLSFNYRAGGTTDTVFLGSISTTDWFHMALTWSASADEVKAFYNGAQTGATQTGLGVWAGTPATWGHNIGSGNTTPITPWSGYLAHGAVWDSVLTPGQIASLASV